MIPYNETSSYEWLGYAKNNIIEAKSAGKDLPIKQRTILDLAYILLDEIQEYLMEN